MLATDVTSRPRGPRTGGLFPNVDFISTATRMLPYIVFLSVLPFALAQSEDSPSPVVSASTAIPSSTAPPTAVIEEQRVPAPQSWCADPIYCAGDVSAPSLT
jgi:hypothetical protein